MLATSVPNGGLPDPKIVAALLVELANQFNKFAEVLFGRLDRIEAELKKQNNNNFLVGLDCLNAAINAESEQIREEHIEAARDNFRSAVNLVEPSLVPIAHFYKATCYDLLGDKRNAIESYHIAFDSAWAYEVNAVNGYWDTKQKMNKLREYNNRFLLPLARLIIRRNSDLNIDENAKRRLRCAHLVDLLQYPWDLKVPMPESEAQQPWDLVITVPELKQLERARPTRKG